MKKVIDEDFLKRIQSIRLQLSLKLRNNRLGKKPSSAKGSSVEFSDYRAYSPGDDYRKIDWSALARFEKLYLKLYMEEQQANVSIFVDTSMSMGSEKKREAELKVSALFAYSSLQEYDRVSLYFFGTEKQAEVKNISGKQGFFKIVDALETQPFGGSSDLLSGLEESAPSLKSGISILISDFLFNHRLEEALRLLRYKKQRILIFQILSEEELGVNFTENLRLRDSESLEEINVDINEESIRLYEKKLHSFLDEIRQICKRHGADYVLIPAEKGVEAFLHKINKLS